MNFFDKLRATVVRAIAPRNYYRMPSGGMSSGGKWPFSLASSGRSRTISHYTTRKNARDAYHESMQARGVVDRMADTVADTGLRLEAAPDANVLGITAEEAESWSRDIESRFDAWARSKKSHRSETINFYQSQRSYQIFQHRDNDIFTRLYYSSDKELLNPLQFEFLDPDQIRGDAYTTTGGPQYSNDGIERDARGREVKYKVWLKQTDGKFKDVDIPAKSRSGRLFMLHGFSAEYAGQGRGYSRLAHAIQEFENVTDLSAAHIKKAISQSQVWGFVEPSADEDADNPFEGILTNYGAGPAAEAFGSDPQPPESAQSVTAESLALVNCYEVPEATASVPGSMFIANLLKGSKIKPFQNSAPSDNFNEFVDSFTAYLSASLSIPIEVLLMRFGQNFSASRGALLLFWRVVTIWRVEMATDYLDPNYEMWLAGEIAAGRVSAPGWSDPRLRQAWLKNSWVGSPPPDIDPSKVSKARKDNLEMGLTTIDRESRNLNGSSAAANKAKLQREVDGLPTMPWTNVGVGNPTAQAEEENS